MERRDFMSMTLGGAALAALAAPQPAGGAEAERPNILWLTSEDNGPHMGCYGDQYADTPNLDKLAAKGMIYRHAWSNAPVCAPARSTIISGMYPPSIGSQHMRSTSFLPPGALMYPCHLREAGYYCTNNSKQDYNLRLTGQVWDESSGKAHWRNRKPGQPFFAIFNVTTTHESQIRRRPHKAVHDPAKVRVPAYHPDTPEARQDWAQYYDKMTEMDATMGQRLREIEEAGLADDTIVFYYGDHGPGMPRSKRWPFNSGLQVPLIVYVPDKWKHLAPKDYQVGGKSERLVGFIDLAPTLLSLCGIKPPDHMQGHAFMGKYETAPPPFQYGFRGRMDERYDMVRTVGDGRYVYLKHYLPHREYGQHVAYMFQTPTTQVWKRMYDEGKLDAAQAKFWQTKPAEELFDLQSDPDEVNNLAGSPEHRAILEKLRAAQKDWAARIRDVGFLPEQEIHDRAGKDAPYVMGHDPKRYPMKKIMAAAESASSLDAKALPTLKEALKDKDLAVRYWGAMGLLARGEKAVAASTQELLEALGDPAAPVRVVAAEALGRYGSKADLDKALPVLADVASDPGMGYTALLAINAIDILGDKAAGVHGVVKKMSENKKQFKGQAGGYVQRVVQTILEKSRG